MLNLKLTHQMKGEALIETLIAMGVLAIGITIAGQIMGTSLRNVNNSKNRVIAVNIAKEGLEAIHNVRDTNWLRYSGKKRECWNHEPAEDPADPCPDTMGNDLSIEPGRYIVYKQPILDVDGTNLGWKWRLEMITKNPMNLAPANPSPTERTVYYNRTEDKAYAWNGDGWMDLTQLYLVDIDPLVNSDNDTAENRYTNDADTYNHALVEEENALGKDYAVGTPFRREIIISYLANNGTEVTDPAQMTTALNRMRIRSKVTWQESKNTFSTELATHLTDYLGREDLSY